MMNAFKDRLKELAVDPKDAFHKEMRQRVGKRATQILEARLKKFILMTPGLLGRMYQIWSRPDVPSKVKPLSGYLLTYMYHPRDFLPESTYGLFGYLDDAYFAAILYEKTLEEMAACGVSAEDAELALLEELKKIKKYVKGVIPKETRAIEGMIREILSGKTDVFQKAMAA